MTPFIRRIVWCVASATAFMDAATLIAAQRPPRSASRSVLEIQILLDRAGFSSGELDGRRGINFTRAIIAFQEAHRLPPGARHQKGLLEALGAGTVETIVSYTITKEDAAGPFTEVMPVDMIEKSKLPSMNYSSLLEALGEKFHAAPRLLKGLNPGARFTEGEHIRVPNVSVGQGPAGRADPAGVEGKEVPALDRPAKPARAHTEDTVVVSKKKSALTMYDRNGRVTFYAPVTSGSEHDPLPLGTWAVASVSRNPIFNYNPALFWDADPAGAKATIPAGPNNPVGVVWIDLTKAHYGIHGTPEPASIGHSESHGCVRLTNWDAATLAGLVKKGTRVVFEE
jgi:lipoprotein-anchoring transpeptidase ErfK/SrfK